MSLLPLATNRAPDVALYTPAGSGGGGVSTIGPSITVSTLTAADRVSTPQVFGSTVIGSFGLLSSLFVTNMAGTSPNDSEISDFKMIQASTMEADTGNFLNVNVTDTASIPLLTTSTLTVNQTPGAPGFYQGGIEFPIFTGVNAYNSLPNASTIAIKSQANWDANQVSTNCLNVVTQGDFGAPFGLYDQLTDLAVGRLLVGGPESSVGLDPLVSGPKPFITASNVIWTNTTPPSVIPYPGAPALVTSPIFTDWAQVSSLYGTINNSLYMFNTNTNQGVGNQPPSVRLQGQSVFVNSGLSTFWNAYVDVGGGPDNQGIIMSVDTPEGYIQTSSDDILLYARDDGIKCGVAQVFEAFTQIWNASGVFIGINQNGPTPFEIQIPAAQSTIVTGTFFASTMEASTINGAAVKDIGALLSSLFAANPSLSTIVY